MLTFEYKGWKVEIDQGEMNGYATYAVWANHKLGCVVAVPYASSRKEAVTRAKQWIDSRNKKNKV
ncbi:hypothetical protein [Okeania sp. SIO3I5]|uniref:hypothetical protein n=1 Tax=Okeania sp. SIO3I5 TaxID=2607805 RepID=UPI0025DB21E2|nr:hypothetical protein [Okeania sp. SIO3I5]